MRQEDAAPMRYRQETTLAQQPQTTAKERILSRAKAMGPQQIMAAVAEARRLGLRPPRFAPAPGRQAS